LFGEDYIDPGNLVQERYIVCASWMDLEDEIPQGVSVLDNPTLYKKDPHNDLHVLKELHKVLSSADVIVAHNGDQYDIKFTEARMLIQGLPPLPPIQKIDTLKVAKDRFLFNSNKLDYLGTVLKVGHKKPTTTGLWMRVLQGDPTAITEMLAYNKQDVLLLKRVFLKLQPYITTHIHYEGGCPRCGGHHIIGRGTHRATTRTYQRFQCVDCGKWLRGTKATNPTPALRTL
jgi:hypothetical protein